MVVLFNYSFISKVDTYDEVCFPNFQVASALAVGEVACEFEHRDLHWSAVDFSSAFGKSRFRENFG